MPGRFGARHLFVAGLVSAVMSHGALAQDKIAIAWEAIPSFDASQPATTKFGSFTYLRGGVLTADHREFGGFSGLRIGEGGTAFLAISDRGKWLRARLQRGDGGAVQKLVFAQFSDVVGPSGEVAARKRDKDAEGLAVLGDRAFVSFERLDVVREYSVSANGSPKFVRQVPYPFPVHELRQNEGLEALAIAPATSVVGADNLVAISEGSINPQGDLFAFVLAGGRRGTFFVKTRDDFNVTDAAFLPDGKLLLLERRFSLSKGLGMRIRLIDSGDIRPGQTVDGPILMEANLGQSIDNMEGISVWQNRQGETVISLISDDNLSFLQQTVYLEFRYDG
ncbi:MAG: esterase-like activity of phytase family protein [Pseudomonadota bacterium]